ncbi:protein OXIDATIVE STRESS 3 LIKE 1-like isoform X1 [Salvia miltiorrhiza]|uniref:protein OXIDATIVE STRESS 3 LIKE 1-like isoform X1 n=1 Tax=Salvia miltiorrhiza TaxID=226208 RepID=UPI0025ACBDA4|nr:protein OXIDATIVE STRESS 3 LIKE 1-like isoform X1 [Salvia miltiorrhiza]
MSIALQRNNSGGGHPIEGPGFVHCEMAYVSSPYDPPELSAADRLSPEAEDASGSLSSSSSSSIGKNSDEHPGGGSGSDEEEVQSQYKGGPLDNLDSLEEVLPVNVVSRENCQLLCSASTGSALKSISKFYSGKSKSFTSLSDAASIPSIKEITKPENAYTRKRKNLLVFNNLWDKNQNSIIKNRIGGISKRPTNSRSMLSLAANMNCSESNSGETSNSNSSPPGCSLPPLPPHVRRSMKSELSSSPPVDKFPSWRSFSLSDLQGAAVAEAATPSAGGLWSNNTENYSHI